MSAATQVHVSPGFSLREFAPGWGAIVMGTAVISTIFAALGHAVEGGAWFQVAANGFLLVAIVVGALIVGITAARWLVYPRVASADLAHPVKGGMSATFAGSFLTLAVAIGRSGEGWIGLAATEVTVAVLGALGGVLALVTGWVFLTGLFARGATEPHLVTGALFIPPVVTVIVPAAFVPLIRAEQAWAQDLLFAMWVLLGMGVVLYLVITAVLFYRTVTHPLPPAGLAPSLFIGMGPAGLIALDVYVLTEAAQSLELVGGDAVALAGFAGAALWGFGLWWMVAAVLVIRRGYERVPFGLPSWGFTFPLGAWSVAGIVLGSGMNARLIFWAGVAGAAVLLLVWAVLAVRTVRGALNGSIFDHQQ